MTTATVNRPVRSVAAYGPTTPRLVRSEWIKAKSVRSTWITAIVGAGLFLAFGLLLASMKRGDWTATPPDNVDSLAASLPFSGLAFAQMAFGVLGVMLVTSEYSSHSISWAISAVPRRVPLVVAKAIVGFTFTFIAVTVTALVAFIGASAIVGKFAASITDPTVLRYLVGSGLATGLVCLLGMGIGWLLRSTPGAISTLFGVLLVLPMVTSMLPTSIYETISKYMPGSALDAIMSDGGSTYSLEPWVGLGLFAVYVLAALVGGAAVLKRKDA